MNFKSNLQGEEIFWRVLFGVIVLAVIINVGITIFFTNPFVTWADAGFPLLLGVEHNQVPGLLLQLGTLIFLIYYVKATRVIAKTSLTHEAIITWPVVTIELVLTGEFKATSYSYVCILVKNHTNLHANVKIKMEYTTKEIKDDVVVRIDTPIPTGKYSGKQVWSLAAQDEFPGETGLDKLERRALRDDEIVILTITYFTSPYGKNEYRSNPPRQYSWNGPTARHWEAEPVTEEVEKASSPATTNN